MDAITRATSICSVTSQHYWTADLSRRSDILTSYRAAVRPYVTELSERTRLTSMKWSVHLNGISGPDFETNGDQWRRPFLTRSECIPLAQVVRAFAHSAMGRWIDALW